MARKNDTTEARAVFEAYRTKNEKLTDRERDIIERYYAFNGHLRHTLQEIGTQYGVTRERIRQVKFLALKKLGI